MEYWLFWRENILEEPKVLSTAYVILFLVKSVVDGLSLTYSQPAITCPKLTIETLEQGVKFVQS